MVGEGDVSVNCRRNTIALIPVEKNISYHLFDYTNFKLIRKTQWIHTTGESELNAFLLANSLLECITSLDFNSDGKKIALITNGLSMVISDVDSGHHFPLITFSDTPLHDKIDDYARCRWSPVGTGTVFVKYNLNKINAVDSEKSQPIFHEPLEVEEHSDSKSSLLSLDI